MMTGVATKFVVIDLVVERLRKLDPDRIAFLSDSAALPYLYLGGMGSAFPDFLASRPEVSETAGDTNSHYFNVWRPVLNLFAGSVTPANRGIYRALRQIQTTLDKLKDVVDREAKFELIGMIDELKALDGAVNDIQTLIQSLNSGPVTLRQRIGLSIAQSVPRRKVKPTTTADWYVRDRLSGSLTGQFLKNLIEGAKASGDNRLQAYALGATIAYATEVCGAPFINSIVRSTRRNHWWRQRWIGNFVDAWVYGFYGLGGANKVLMDGPVPRPFYTDWPNVTGSRLHTRIEIGSPNAEKLLDAVRDNIAFPNLLPDDFVTYWKTAFETTYGPAVPDGQADEKAIQSAYAMAWLVLWAQTSGELLPSVPIDQINYPDSCGPRPEWVAADGSIAVGTAPGGVIPPPDASEDTDPSIAEIISGIIAAIIGVITIATGNVTAGIAVIVVAAGLIADGVTDPDWDELRCHVGWVSAYLINLTNTMHDMLQWSGIGYPYTSELAHNDLALTFSGQVIPPQSALGTAFSVPINRDYPASQWNPLSAGVLQSNWANLPSEPVENPPKPAYPTDATFPFHFVDGLVPFSSPPTTTPPPTPIQSNPLQLNGGRPLIRDPATFADRRSTLNIRQADIAFFGNAVDVSIDLITKAEPSELLNWDRDADPGLGSPTWFLGAATDPRSSAIPE